MDNTVSGVRPVGKSLKSAGSWVRGNSRFGAACGTLRAHDSVVRTSAGLCALAGLGGQGGGFRPAGRGLILPFSGREPAARLVVSGRRAFAAATSGFAASAWERGERESPTCLLPSLAGVGGECICF